MVDIVKYESLFTCFSRSQDHYITMKRTSEKQFQGLDQSTYWDNAGE
jgi:hypothetical protein